MSGGNTDYEILQEKGQRLEAVIAELDEKSMRWLELSEYD
jgi:hypothetical protein